MYKLLSRSSFARLTICLVLGFVMHAAVAGQDNIAELRAKAADLMKQSRMTEAVPVLERILQLDDRDANSYEMLGSALLGLAVNTKDVAEKKTVRLAARQAFIKARDLGNDSNFVKAMIASLPMDGSEARQFSTVPRSHALTYEGEQAFTQGKIDEAISLYKQAHEADPKNYFAALFAGDMYLKKEEFTNAETWYQKAIAIDPNIETAYRYSATPLMRQRKYDQARDRYVEAWITEPYSRFSVNGILQWGQITGTRLGHPKIDVPKIEIGADGKAKSTLNINPLNDDGGMAWMSYITTREQWKNEKFKKAYPAEKEYRHSVAEEADALRSVVKLAKTLKAKQPNPQFQAIEAMDKDGLLEAYILMAIPTEGIAGEHPAYLASNRAKLRQYVVKYVIEANK
jgi:tetratricopeptide (TPR) repeat protein